MSDIYSLEVELASDDVPLYYLLLSTESDTLQDVMTTFAAWRATDAMSMFRAGESLRVTWRHKEHTITIQAAPGYIWRVAAEVILTVLYGSPLEAREAIDNNAFTEPRKK